MREASPGSASCVHLLIESPYSSPKILEGQGTRAVQRKQGISQGRGGVARDCQGFGISAMSSKVIGSKRFVD